MASVEQAVTSFLNLVRLSRIKSKIIAFSLLATLIPSFFMGWLSYRNNRRVLREKVTQELVNLTSNASRELDFWFKDREYEVRVFASSYEVSENLAKIHAPEGAEHFDIEELADPPLRRLQTYLGSVEQRFADYAELLVIDLDGRIVATSKGRAGEGRIREDWIERIEADEAIVGDLYRDEQLGVEVIPIAEPVRDAQNTLIGVLIAKLDFHSVGKILTGYAPNEDDELYIITQDAVVLISSRPMTAAFMTSTLSPGATEELFAEERLPHEFTSFRGTEVVGTLERIDRLGWGMVAHKERAEAYAQIVRLRNVTLLLIAAVLVAVGLVAYLLGLAIVRPLDRLTAGAAKIADGDLRVRLPIYSRGELGDMTRVFNHMAKRLRQVLGELDATNQALREKNEELHRLSITDALTALHNRNHMMETLAMEVARALRYDHVFSILMIDIDDFKKYNDTHGHLAGDEVLRELGAFLKSSLRTEDYAARYGGEEFLILLPETASDGAWQLADRLRQRLEERQLGATADLPGITVSVGVAAFPENGSDPEELISKADAAMYAAKQGGRNQVIMAKGQRKGRKKAKG